MNIFSTMTKDLPISCLIFGCFLLKLSHARGPTDSQVAEINRLLK
jgi:hypothetical protein